MRLTRFIPAAFAAIALLPAIASAQSVQFVGANHSEQLGSPFSSPRPNVNSYSMKYAPNGSTFDIYCIDFDNSFTGNAFNARILTFADAVNSTLSFGGVDNFTALKRALGTTTTFPSVGPLANTEANYLHRLKISASLSNGFASSPNGSWDERHYAIWGLFSSNVTPYVNDFINDPNVIGAAAESLVNGGYTASEWRVIIDERAWDRSFTGNLEQTSIVVSTVPEPGTYALVGVGMIVLAGVARRRNRNSRQVIAGQNQLV